MGVIITLIGGIFWGFSGAAGKYVYMTTGVNSNWLVPWRLFLAGLVLLIVLYLRQGKAIFRIWKEHPLSMVIYAAFGSALCQYSYFTAIEYSNAAIATILQYMAPPMVMVYMCYKEKKTPAKIEGLSLFIACLGIFILCTHLQFSTLIIAPLALFWGVISAITLMMNTVQPVHLLKKYGAVLPLAWGMFTGGSILLLAFRPWQYEVVYTKNLFFGMFTVIVFGTILAFSMYMEGVRRLGPTKASLVACVEPISATLISMLWLKEDFQNLDFLGIFLILVAVASLSLPNAFPKKLDKKGKV